MDAREWSILDSLWSEEDSSLTRSKMHRHYKATTLRRYVHIKSDGNVLDSC